MADMDCATRTTFSWCAHPARERLLAAMATVVVIAAMAVCVLVAYGSLTWAVLSAVVLVATLNRFFLPTRFAIDDEGITARHPLGRQRFLWREVRRFVHDRRGGYLSTSRRASRLDAFRGMHVQFGRHRDEVVRSIRLLVSSEGDRRCAG